MDVLRELDTAVQQQKIAQKALFPYATIMREMSVKL